MTSKYFSLQQHEIPSQYIREYPGATLDDQEDTLMLHVKQYTPIHKSKPGSKGITVIGAHANGFPKELYEPLWDDLYSSLLVKGQDIESIWIADVAHQGRSGVLNDGKLGNDPSWFDHPRDLLFMINFFREKMSRPLVGVGHSMGGNHLVNLSLIHPRLLSSLVLIDPVIQINTASSNFAPPSIAQASTFRRDCWPSRAEAETSFKRSRFYQTWDSRVLERWIEFGLRSVSVPTSSSRSASGSDAEGPVTLTTTKDQEVFTFLRPNFSGRDSEGNPVIDRVTHADVDLNVKDSYPFYRPETSTTLKNLPHLRPSVLYIFGGRSLLSKPNLCKEKMELTGTGVGGSGGEKEGRVKQVRFENGSHLMPMEIVEETATASAGWLAEEMERWNGLEVAWKKDREGKTKAERTQVSEEWKVKIGGDPRAKKL